RSFRSSVSMATAPTEIYTLSLHDALPISGEFVAIAVEPDRAEGPRPRQDQYAAPPRVVHPAVVRRALGGFRGIVEPAELGGEQRSEEHTSELQSRENLVCRLLLEKKKK